MDDYRKRKDLGAEDLVDAIDRALDARSGVDKRPFRNALEDVESVFNAMVERRIISLLKNGKKASFHDAFRKVAANSLVQKRPGVQPL